jgi:branched-chain amino acid transport system ATP-binding protein
MVSPDTPIVEARELHVHYVQSHVLHGVSIAVRGGETVGLLGRNGMGKTTLIRTLLGLVPASRGSIRVRGIDMTQQPTERIVRHGIGYVPEGRGIFPNLSVRENLVMAARAGRGGRLDWTLARVLQTFPRLAERLDHGGNQLSGGEQQMLAIGRALMTNPDLMVLDEATEGLAPLVVAEIWRTIALIRDSGIAALIVDRNYRAVLAHCDRGVVLEKGLVVLEGPARELLAGEERLRSYLSV